MKTQSVASPDLAWLRRTLWPDERFVRVSTADRPDAGYRRVETFAVVPSARRPRLLVPTRRGGGAGFATFNNGMTQRARLRKAVAGRLFDLGPGRALLPDRWHVDVAAEIDEDDLRALLAERHVAAVLGRRDLVVSIVFGSLRPNRKPVLQAATPGGAVLAFAKVAWNELTRRLVRNEAEVLRRWTSTPPRSFALPGLVHAGTWQDRDIVVTTAIRSHVWRRGALNAWPPPRVLLEIAGREGLTTTTLGAAPLWTDLRLRAGSCADAPTAERLTDLADRFEERFGDLDVEVGWWHGDWAPWNMTWLDGRPAIWDWERARDGVPIGTDAIHFAFQVALRRSRRRVGEAVAGTLGSAGSFLSRAGVDPRTAPALLALYLFELFLRYEDATASGVLPQDDPVRSGVLEALASAMEGPSR